MRKLIICCLVALSAPISAQQTRPLKLETPGNGKNLPVKPPKSDTSCAAYGAGFMKLAGSDTCVKLGGSVSVDTGTNVGR